MNYPYYPQQTQQNGFNWVQGEAGAKSYLVAPNNTVLLMDAEDKRFYLKSADNAGMPSLRVFEYTEIAPDALAGSNSHDKDLTGQFVTRKEYDALKGKIDEVLKKIDEPKKTERIRKAVDDD